MAEVVSRMLKLEELGPEAVWKRVRKDWLISDTSSETWFGWMRDRQRQLSTQPQPASRLVLIAEPDPALFLASVWAALLSRWNVALANPNWGAQEWLSANELICPDIVWGENVQALKLAETASTITTTVLSEPTILIPTGGSSGKIKFARHTWKSLMASVSGFCQYFSPEGKPINAYCVLPVYHVSGLMQALRAWASGGQVAIAPFKLLETTPSPHFIATQNWYISLIPTQLARLIQAHKGAWLSQFQAVFLGGAPPWTSLLDEAAALKIPLCLSYGMTETAAMVTALKPSDFLRGVRSSGRSLPHATIEILAEGRSPLPSTANASRIGQIVIHSVAISSARGFGKGFVGTPETLQSAAKQETLYTDDLGYLDINGHLHITGRASNKIISGGENIFPAEVEAAIRSTGQVQDVCVLGWPDSQWGEAVIAAYVPARPDVSVQSLREAIAPTISRYKQPKRWIELTTLPRNAQGKLNSTEDRREAVAIHFNRLSANTERRRV